MSSPELDNLVRIGQLKREPPNARELSGLLASGESRLADARRNLAEYEGHLEHDERLLADMLAAAELLLSAIRNLPGDGYITVT